ncbi:MAG: hypothetical protein ACTS8S_00535 [Giesbergeria sp.]
MTTPHGQAPASTSGDFIRRTNEDYAAWCATKYTPEFNSKGPDLRGLWAWQEQQRRMDDLLRQAPINLNCKSAQKRLATLWGFVPAQAAPTAVVVEPSNTVAYLDIGEGCYMDLGTDLNDDTGKDVWSYSAELLMKFADATHALRSKGDKP